MTPALTRAGAAVAAGGALLAAAGVALRYPELTLLAAGCAAALAGAAIWVAAGRTHVTTSRRVTPPRPTEGQPVTVAVEVVNRGSRPSRPVTAVDLVDGVPYDVPVPALAAGGRHTARYDYLPARRGRVVLAPTAVGRRDPFGLLSASRPTGRVDVVRVHPRRHPGALPPAVAGAEDGTRAAAGHPAYDDTAFHSLRDYRPGDPLRRIDWRTTAKRGIPTVRQQEAPREAGHVLLLDTDARVCSAGHFEDAVRITASLAAAISDAGLALDLRTTGADPPVRLARAGADLLPVLDLLCDVAQQRAAAASPVPLVAALLALPSYPGGTALTVVTGRLSGTAAAAVTAARRRVTAVYAVQVGATPGPGALNGVRHVAVAASEEFVPAWNRLVRP